MLQVQVMKGLATLLLATMLLISTASGGSVEILVKAKELSASLWYEEALDVLSSIENSDAEATDLSTRIKQHLEDQDGNVDKEDYSEFRQDIKDADDGNLDKALYVGNEFLFGDLPLRDIDRGHSYIRMAADKGQPNAQFRLGDLLTQGAFLKQDKKEGFQWFRKASDNGHKEATHRVALAHLYGEGVDQDVLTAIALLTRNAEEKWPNSQVLLGKIKIAGSHLPLDIAGGVQMIMSAADAGDGGAIYEMGLLYDFGIGVQEDPTKAFEHYSQAAAKHIGSARYMLGVAYYTGRGVSADIDKGFENFVKSVEPEAYFRLGLMSEVGFWGQKKDLKAARKFYGVAKNHPIASERAAMISNGTIKGLSIEEVYEVLYHTATSHEQFSLGIVYENGLKNLPRDLQKAAYWFKKAADQNYPKAETKLGEIYFLGSGVEENHKKALEYFERAAQKGSVDAYAWLGTFYYHGHGVEQNYKNAMEWFNKAADLSHPSAQFNVGSMLHHGQGVPRNDLEALKWIQRSAENGFEPAKETTKRLEAYIENTKKLVFEGFSHLAKNENEKGFEKFKALSDEDSDIGHVLVANAYEKGVGVPKDMKLARAYYEKAAKFGQSDAITALQRLGAN
jgi:TPR repeat protein